MVNIAIVGASSLVAREVLDLLSASGKHDIHALIRKNPADFPALPGVKWVQTTYQDKKELVELFRGRDTVLCFLQSVQPDPEGLLEKGIIDAVVEAGVKRYAPSEWQAGPKLEAAIEQNQMWMNKLAIRKYLEELNREKKMRAIIDGNGHRNKVIEYSLFQPGHIMNYLSAPQKSCNYIPIFSTYFDVENMRALLDADHKDVEMCFTAVQDLAGVVTAAVDYEGEWPVRGGLTGTRIKVSDIVALLEKVRGRTLNVDWVKQEDYLKGDLKSDYDPKINHPALNGLPKEHHNAAIRHMLIGLLSCLSRGAWQVGDDWNKLLPDYKFKSLEEFLRENWEGK